MRDGNTPQMVTTLGGARITTAIAARLDFKSETIFCWTGLHRIQPTGSGDTMLDGNIFDPIDTQLIELGDNTFSYSGSNELTMSLNIGGSPPAQIVAAQTYPNEYQSRPVILWRAVMIPPTNPLAEPVWMWRRWRTGSMDQLVTTADGISHKMTLTIESHQARISNATGLTYLNQKEIDPLDTSNDYAVSIANGSPAPTKASGSGGAGIYGGGGFNQNLYAIQRLL